ncbi:MAG: sulfatase-like hydrolase/transferase [Pseudomonadota bacterium]
MRCLPIIALVALPACRETFPTYKEPFEARNLLMISVDTYRRDYMTRYGSARGLTPFMDELAERSLVLDDHVSCSDWTLPSVLCVGAGRYEPAYGFVSRLQPTYREVVPEHTTLAGWLGEQGFYSILMSSNSWLEGDWNHDGGYDYAEHAGTDDGRRIWELGRNKLFEAQDEGLAGEDRWFLHIHLKEPHSPYNPPAEYLEGLDDLPPIDYDLTTQDGHDAARFSLQSMDEAEREAVLAHLLLRYDGEMAYEDDILKDIWNDANARGLLKNTVVSIWTDHGEQEYERENWGHAFQLYQEEAGAVALFWHPDIEPEAWTGPTDHIDIAPTLLQMFDLSVPDEVEGQPLGQAPEDRTLFAITVARLGPLLQATRAGMRMQYDYNSGTLEVYDLPGDPGEEHDLYDPFDPEQTTLWEELSAWADQIEPLMQEYPRVEPER